MQDQSANDAPALPEAQQADLKASNEQGRPSLDHAQPSSSDPVSMPPVEQLSQPASGKPHVDPLLAMDACLSQDQSHEVAAARSVDPHISTAGPATPVDGPAAGHNAATAGLGEPADPSGSSARGDVDVPTPSAEGKLAPGPSAPMPFDNTASLATAPAGPALKLKSPLDYTLKPRPLKSEFGMVKTELPGQDTGQPDVKAELPVPAPQQQAVKSEPIEGRRGAGPPRKRSRLSKASHVFDDPEDTVPEFDTEAVGALAAEMPEAGASAEERPKGKRPVAATVFCSFGAGLAQLPFIATQLGERRRGHARTLCNAVCRLLSV